MKIDIVQYLSDAISRAEIGDVRSPSGSWIAGMFGKGANLFEKEIHSYVLRLIDICDLDYENNFRAQMKGKSFDKLTLGQLIDVINKGAKLRPNAVAGHVPGGWTVASFAKSLGKINCTWVQTKHGDEVQESTLVTQMKSMLTITEMLRKMK
jgi:hypothetical protein